MNIEMVQWIIIFGVGFYSVLYWVYAAKAIYELQRETDELRNQLKLDLDNMHICIDCLEKNCEHLREDLFEVEKHTVAVVEDVEALREAHNNMKKDFYAVCEDD